MTMWTARMLPLALCLMAFTGCADDVASPPPRADAAAEVTGDGATVEDVPEEQSTEDGPDVPEPPEDVPPLKEDDDATCPLLRLTPTSAFDAGPDATSCPPGRAQSCRCDTGGAGIQTCDFWGRLGDCLCVARPMVPSTHGDAGTVVSPGVPTELPPRLVRPLSGMRAYSRRPTLRWVLPPGLPRARVELCDDRPCERRFAQAEVAGTSWRSPTALRPGVVFWRVLALRADGSTAWTSATWEFGVRHRDTPTDLVSGPLKDFDGDGYDDALLDIGGGHGALLRGGRGGARRVLDPMLQVEQRFADGPATVGDLNGDGLADIAVGGVDQGHDGSSLTSDRYLRLLYGRNDCPRLVEGPVLRAPLFGIDYDFARGATITDFNGDGFQDLVVASYQGLHLYLGGPRGLSTRPTGSIGVADAGRFTFGDGRATHAPGDIDGDGYGDVAVGDAQRENGNGEVQVFYGNPGARLEARVQSIPGGIGARRLRCRFGYRLLGGDFDADGFADALLICEYGFDYYYRGSVQGLREAQEVEWPLDGMRSVGDLDGDGRLEVLGSGADGTRSILASASEDGFASAPAVSLYYLEDRGSGGAIVSPGDMDSDGYDDILVSSGRSFAPRYLHLIRGRRLALMPPRISWEFGDWHPTVLE